MKSNLGQSSLRRKRRSGTPMSAYDRLPGPLRLWLSEAALPWSPASARRLWLKSRAKGLTQEETFELLNEVEAKTLARDRNAVRLECTSQH